jgi:hypothetical protein
MSRLYRVTSSAFELHAAADSKLTMRSGARRELIGCSLIEGLCLHPAATSGVTPRRRCFTAN